MRMYDIIHKKRDGGELTPQEIRAFISGYTAGEIPDYQASALAMAIYFKGMTFAETLALTEEMAKSGDQMDLSSIPGVKVDKHSTGGVGDKTTLIVGPIASACGVKIAKMSGRGLGHTGGTIDKLESVPGLRTDLSTEEFLHAVRNTGISVVGQTGNLCPADKKLYALRDVTATVDSLPLIASSVMCKKLASGADAILLDVKVGSGAFMKTKEDASRLAREMVRIGNGLGRRTMALITDMDRPLGRSIGNSLEISEAVQVLHGTGDKVLTALCMELASYMVVLGERAKTLEEARQMVEATIHDGKAFHRLVRMVEAQGGDPDYIRSPSRLPLSPVHLMVKAPKAGYITALNAEECGMAAMELGAGRETKDSEIDPGAGILLLHNKGDLVKAREPLAIFYTSSEAKAKCAEERFLSALKIGEKGPVPTPIILDRIKD